MSRTALITGSSSGFGRLTALTLAKHGWNVLATMRDLSRQDSLLDAARALGLLDRIEILPLDITDHAQVNQLAATLAARAVPLDAIVNNAGFAMAGFAEDVSDAELRRQFDTNFFAHAEVTRAFLPQLRRQGFGHLVFVSSISGEVGFPGVSSYAASKHALEGWAESLRLELKPLGIQVALVEPGSFETNIWTRGAVLSERSGQGMLQQQAAMSTDQAQSPQDAQSPNAARMARLGHSVLKAKKRPDAQIVAHRIAKILESPRPRLRHIVGLDAHLALLLHRFLPWKIYEKILLRASGLDR
jgi:NAD(P)-dependent dehydrogenase (short-subunit alcohol dehydrogenase family)